MIITRRYLDEPVFRVYFQAPENDDGSSTGAGSTQPSSSNNTSNNTSTNPYTGKQDPVTEGVEHTGGIGETDGTGTGTPSSSGGSSGSSGSTFDPPKVNQPTVGGETVTVTPSTGNIQSVINDDYGYFEGKGYTEEETGKLLDGYNELLKGDFTEEDQLKYFEDNGLSDEDADILRDLQKTVAYRENEKTGTLTTSPGLFTDSINSLDTNTNTNYGSTNSNNSSSGKTGADTTVDNSNVPSGQPVPTGGYNSGSNSEFSTTTDTRYTGYGVDPNATDYNTDTWNRGLVETSTTAVSDERCKQFISQAVKKDPVFKKVMIKLRG